MVEEKFGFKIGDIVMHKDPKNISYARSIIKGEIINFDRYNMKLKIIETICHTKYPTWWVDALNFVLISRGESSYSIW